MSFKLTQKTTARVEEVKRNTRRNFAHALEDLEPIVLPVAREMAPERSGRYKKSLGFAVDEQNLEAALYSGGKQAPHAHLVEFGTQKMAPFGTMRKAVEQTRDAMGRAVVKRMKGPV